MKGTTKAFMKAGRSFRECRSHTIFTLQLFQDLIQIFLKNNKPGFSWRYNPQYITFEHLVITHILKCHCVTCVYLLKDSFLYMQIFFIPGSITEIEDPSVCRICKLSIAFGYCLFAVNRMWHRLRDAS